MLDAVLMLAPLSRRGDGDEATPRTPGPLPARSRGEFTTVRLEAAGGRRAATDCERRRVDVCGAAVQSGFFVLHAFIIFASFATGAAPRPTPSSLPLRRKSKRRRRSVRRTKKPPDAPSATARVFAAGGGVAVPTLPSPERGAEAAEVTSAAEKEPGAQKKGGTAGCPAAAAAAENTARKAVKPSVAFEPPLQPAACATACARRSGASVEAASLKDVAPPDAAGGAYHGPRVGAGAARAMAAAASASQCPTPLILTRSVVTHVALCSVV